MTQYERDWARDEIHTTMLNPIFHIWQNAKGEWYYICKFDYEDNTDQTFKTREALMLHIKVMLAKYSKAHRLLPWSYTKIDTSFTYKEDFGYGLETYKGVFQASTVDDAPDYIRWGEVVDDYMKIMKGLNNANR